MLDFDELLSIRMPSDEYEIPKNIVHRIVKKDLEDQELGVFIMTKSFWIPLLLFRRT